MSEYTYLIRYGVMGHVARLSASAEYGSHFVRGQLVVIQSDRGVELGEVLVAVDGKSTPTENGTSDATTGSNGRPRVLREAAPDDVDRSRQAEQSRSDRFALCERVLRDEEWPWELIDVEPLLDGRSAVLHYLGPAQLDVAPIRARFRVACDLDVVLEPVGVDPDAALLEAAAGLDTHGGGCGNCDCGEKGGGCGAKAASGSAEAPQGATSAAHSGCDSCGISKWVAARNRETV